jgi:hypothetical protein
MASACIPGEPSHDFSLPTVSMEPCTAVSSRLSAHLNWRVMSNTSEAKLSIKGKGN